MEEARSVLRDFGLSPYETRAYGVLVSFGSLTAVKLASKSGIPRSRVYEVLRELAKKGFVSIRTGKPTVYEAVPPEIALKGRIETFRKEADQKIEEARKKAEAALPILAELGELTAKKEPEPQDIASVYFNRERFRNKITDLIRESAVSFRMFTSEMAGLKRELDRDRVSALFDAIRRRIDVKSIHGLHSDMDLDLYMDFQKKGAEIRVPKVELKETFWIFDGNIAAMAVYDRGAVFKYGLVIRNRFLSSLLSSFFDEHWKKSVPAEQVVRKLQEKAEKKST